MQVARMLAITDLCINVILAGRGVGGVEGELPLRDDIRPGAELRCVEKFTEITVIRIGVIIKTELNNRTIRTGLAELEKVFH